MKLRIFPFYLLFNLVYTQNIPNSFPSHITSKIFTLNLSDTPLEDEYFKHISTILKEPSETPDLLLISFQSFTMGENFNDIYFQEQGFLHQQPCEKPYEEYILLYAIKTDTTVLFIFQKKDTAFSITSAYAMTQSEIGTSPIIYSTEGISISLTINFNLFLEFIAVNWNYADLNIEIAALSYQKLFNKLLRHSKAHIVYLFGHFSSYTDLALPPKIIQNCPTSVLQKNYKKTTTRGNKRLWKTIFKDKNFNLDSISNEEMLDFDHLNFSKFCGRIFFGFEEEEIQFPPTFKIVEGGNYDSNVVPSFPSRVLVKYVSPDVRSKVNNSDYRAYFVKDGISHLMVSFGSKIEFEPFLYDRGAKILFSEEYKFKLTILFNVLQIKSLCNNFLNPYLKVYLRLTDMYKPFQILRLNKEQIEKGEVYFYIGGEDLESFYDDNRGVFDFRVTFETREKEGTILRIDTEGTLFLDGVNEDLKDFNGNYFYLYGNFVCAKEGVLVAEVSLSLIGA